MIDQTRTLITAIEFLALPESNQPVELINGEVIMSPSPIPQHQIIVANVIVILRQIARQLGGRVFGAPLDVYLDDDNVVQPDVMWVADDSQCQIAETHLRNAPDLVIEVLSPSTARYDKTAKFRLYQRHGVREYWLIDPAAKYVEIWSLQEERFIQQGIYGPKETIASAVLSGRKINAGTILDI